MSYIYSLEAQYFRSIHIIGLNFLLKYIVSSNLFSILLFKKHTYNNNVILQSTAWHIPIGCLKSLSAPNFLNCKEINGFFSFLFLNLGTGESNYMGYGTRKNNWLY